MDADGDSEIHEELIFKVLVVGEPGVGKTSLIKKYVNGVFTGRYKSTIGADFSHKTIIRTVKQSVDGKETVTIFKITLQFWDLAGQERINSQVKVYYRQSDGVLCLCDVTREETKNQALLWKQAVLDNSTNQEGIQNFPPCVLLFNKMDEFATSKSWNLKELPPLKPGDDPDMISVEVTDDLLVANDVNIINNNNIQSMPTILDLDIDGYNEKRYELNNSIKPYVEFACLNDFIAGVPTSAKHGVGIDYAIKLLVTKMLDRRLKDITISKDSNVVSFEDLPQQKSYCGSYC
jgi:small GTP-binding protein